MDDIKARIEAARAKKAELDAREAARTEEAEQLQELADLEREIALREALENAISEHGEVGKKLAVVNAAHKDGTILGSIIVKRGHQAHFRRFQDLEKIKRGDIEKLVRPNVVWPPIEVVDPWLEELPHTWMKLADAIAGLHGVGGEEARGKS